MHVSGQRVVSASRSSPSRHDMQIPSAKRRASKVALPWGGVLGVCILGSVSVNIYSLTLNKYQFQLLDRLMAPASELEVPSWNSEMASVTAVDAPESRRLSGTPAPAGSGSSSGSGSASAPAGHGSGACGSNHTSSSAGGGHSGPHPHDALLYLFNALVIGAAVMQLSARYPILQQTIVLFVIGFICSLVLKGIKLEEKIGVWGDSYNMWMNIDPHLLLFTLLPALLAGDAMTIDTSIAKRVGLQCIYLAGPGVLIGGFSTAFFLNAYIEWQSEKTFLLSLCAGSILCATDPVAVVALLKELGASPMLTVQIQGESLLNDGTAIVLYLISYNMLSGQDYDWLDITTFLMEKALMAFALGLFIGYFFFAWIRFVANKLDHSSGMIQITLTLCCAYVSFILVEGVLGLSGVLATVAASLVLAHHMWPYIVAEESMHHVWHTFEALGNIIVFFLAGSITGYIVVDIDPVDWLHLIVIYIVLLTIRATLLFSSRPLLRYLHADKLPVSWQDATLMTWGGLRGAVGLALAIQVNNGRAPDTNNVPQIHQKDAERLLFFVSGIAFLTTLVNATTAPKLVEKLKITALPAARQTLLKMFHQQLVNFSEDSNSPPEVTESLRHMLHEAAEEIDHQQVSKDGPKAERELSTNCGGGHGGDHGHGHGHEEGLPLKTAGKAAPDDGDVHQDNKELIAEMKQVRLKYEGLLSKNDLQLFSGEFPKNMLGKVDKDDKEGKDGKKDETDGEDDSSQPYKTDAMVKLIENQFVDTGMAKVVNQCFLTLVYNNYWKLIGLGKLRPGGSESDVLLTSVRISLSPYRADLTDFRYVSEKMIEKDDGSTDEAVGAAKGALAESVEVSDSGCIGETVSSNKFNIFIALAILFNSVVVCIEEIGRTEDNDDHAAWVILDGFFTGIFVVEWFMKNIALRCAYYKDNWNRFDFGLVIVGVFGFVMSLATQGGEAKLAGQTRVMRLARVLRTMRFLRIFRLFNARLGRDKFVSMDLAKYMTKITTMQCFVLAHIMAQNDLIRYFGGNGELDEVDESEIARCILQSLVSTYKALIAAADFQQKIGVDIICELSILYKRKTITESLSAWVEKAHHDGAISATEAHAILHPLNHQISVCMKSMSEKMEGVISSSVAARSSQSLGDRMHLLEGAGPGAESLDDRMAALGKKEEDQNPAATDMVPDSPEASPAQPELPSIAAAP